MSVRIGQGFDVHAFDEGDHVMLGGIAIPHSHGLKAHSDGDVALHALSDALLGALALGDIGHYFPDTDPQWQGADSGQLLSAIYGSILDAGWRLGNADLTVICQAPKLAPHIAGTLSYTHLRAHETEADLVCRLLLEKKKKQN